MKAIALLRYLGKSVSSVFSFSDLMKILNKNEGYSKVFLNRIVNRKLLIRIERGKYALADQHPFSIASSITFPSYISFISAYSFYGLTTQIPIVFFVVTLKQKKEFSYDNYQIKFVKITKGRFFGYRKEFINNKIVFIAEKEKAVLDSLFLPIYCPLSETHFALKEMEINKEKLLDYVKKMNSSIVAKRLGYLLDLIGIDLYSELKSVLSRNYDLLNPLRPKTMERNEKWKLIINEVFE